MASPLDYAPPPPIERGDGDGWMAKLVLIQRVPPCDVREEEDEEDWHLARSRQPAIPATFPLKW